MIRMPGGDGGGAVELFGEHGADQHVGPGRLAEGNQQVGAAAQILAVAVRPADQEPGTAHTIVAPVAEQSGKILAREGFAALVEDHDAVIRGDAGREQARFVGARLAASLDLLDRERAKADGAACTVETAGIVVDQRRFGAGFDAPDRRYDQPHLGRDGHRCRSIALGQPHAFEVVELAHLGPEDMHDDVARVDQRPVALFDAFEARDHLALVFEFFDQLVDDGPDMARRAATGHDHMIGDGRFAGKIDCDDVDGLIVFQRRHGQGEQAVGPIASCLFIKSPVADCAGFETRRRGYGAAFAMDCQFQPPLCRCATRYSCADG